MTNESIIPAESVISNILIIRDQKVILIEILPNSMMFKLKH